VSALVLISTLAVPSTALACDPAIALGAPGPTGRILFDRGGETWVMDGDGKHQNQILKTGGATLNPDGIHVAYWNGKTLQVLSLIDGCETTVDDTLLSAPLDIGWSGDGRTLGYVGTSNRGKGLHVLPFPAAGANPKVFPYFNHVSLSHNGRYALTIVDGVTQVDLLTGARTVLEATDKAHPSWGATYTGSRDMLAVLTSVLDDTGDSDEPDCRGANTALQLFTASGPISVPFPAGFNSTLDYEFDLSPDGTEIAIAFGADRCDYPGDVASVYLFSLRDHKLTRVTPKNRLAGRVKFSPNGKALIYTDFQGTGTTAIFRYDLATGHSRQLTSPRSQDSDYVVEWR
jgi:Tol biopolymer transport system component